MLQQARVQELCNHGDTLRQPGLLPVQLFSVATPQLLVEVGEQPENQLHLPTALLSTVQHQALGQRWSIQESSIVKHNGKDKK